MFGAVKELATGGRATVGVDDTAETAEVAEIVADEDQQPLAPGDDERFMARALALAAKGITTTHPNPRVGCVVVRDGAVAGEGWHRIAGEEHAEIIALRQAGKRAKGATLYLTLEPCSHHGKTPPCVNAVIKAGISRAVIAMEDPNPLVNRAGISALQGAGIAVTLGVGKQPAQKLNRGFCKRILPRQAVGDAENGGQPGRQNRHGERRKPVDYLRGGAPRRPQTARREFRDPDRRRHGAAR